MSDETDANVVSGDKKTGEIPTIASPGHDPWRTAAKRYR
jgi:hypothetical protein